VVASQRIDRCRINIRACHYEANDLLGSKIGVKEKPSRKEGEEKDARLVERRVTIFYFF